MVQMFMRGLKKVSALWSVRFRVSALERFCYKWFFRISSGTIFFVRLREVSPLEGVRFREVPLQLFRETTYRSSHQRYSLKKAIFKNFTIITGKHLCWSLSLITYIIYIIKNFIKKRLKHRCILVNIAKFLKAPILKKIYERLLLNTNVQNAKF